MRIFFFFSSLLDQRRRGGGGGGRELVTSGTASFLFICHFVWQKEAEEVRRRQGGGDERGDERRARHLHASFFSALSLCDITGEEEGRSDEGMRRRKWEHEKGRGEGRRGGNRCPCSGEVLMFGWKHNLYSLLVLGLLHRLQICRSQCFLLNFQNHNSTPVCFRASERKRKRKRKVRASICFKQSARRINNTELKTQ